MKFHLTNHLRLCVDRLLLLWNSFFQETIPDSDSCLEQETLETIVIGQSPDVSNLIGQTTVTSTVVDQQTAVSSTVIGETGISSTVIGQTTITEHVSSTSLPPLTDTVTVADEHINQSLNVNQSVTSKSVATLLLAQPPVEEKAKKLKHVSLISLN